MNLNQSEHDIQTTILNLLPYYKVKAIRLNTGRYSVGEGKYKRMILGAPTGTPDIIGCRNGRMVMIEVKRPGNKPTAIQNQVMDEWREYGADVFVATSLEDVDKHFKEIDLKTIKNVI